MVHWIPADLHGSTTDRYFREPQQSPSTSLPDKCARIRHYHDMRFHLSSIVLTIAELSSRRALALNLWLGMNSKRFISALLVLVLVPVSAFGLACDIRCGLEGIAVDRCHLSHAHSRDANASTKTDMPPMHCHSNQHRRRADLSQAVASCELTSQACNQEHCAPDASWLAGQRSSSKQLVVSLISPLEMAISASSTATTQDLSSPRSLPPPIYRPLAVLRI
jgi:hypothetical protein